jgi:hypothetical protein
VHQQEPGVDQIEPAEIAVVNGDICLFQPQFLVVVGLRDGQEPSLLGRLLLAEYPLAITFLTYDRNSSQAILELANGTLRELLLGESGPGPGMAGG